MIAKLCGIYKILNIITRDYYLGGSVNVHSRWSRHRCELRKNIHGNTHLQNAWNKYGEQAFEFSIILLCDREHKLYFEDGFIKLLKPAYNIATDAKAPMQGRYFSDESKSKMSESHKGQYHTTETRSKMSEAKKGELCYNFGKHLSTETRAKISIAQIGIHPSESTRAKLSEAQRGNTKSLGHKCSVETLAKMSTSQQNRPPRTAETRAKMSESAKNRPPISEETRAKLSKVLTGMHRSTETRAKMSEANKGELNPNFGKHPPEETRRKIRESASLRWAKKKAEMKAVLYLEIG